MVATSKDLCRPQSDPLPQRGALPRAFREEVLKVFEFGAGERFAESFDVFAGATSQQPGDVVVGVPAHVASRDLEKVRDHIAKTLQPPSRGMDVERFIFLKAGCRSGRIGRVGLALPTRGACNSWRRA